MAATTPSSLSVAMIPAASAASPSNSLSCSLLFRSETLNKTQQKLPPSHLALLKSRSFILPSRQYQQTCLSAHLLPKKKPSPFPLSAVRKGKSGGGNLAVAESNDFAEEDEDEFDFLDDDGDYDDDDDDVEDGEMLLPLEKMQKWLERKPRGFGEGKVYDTSVEDKLMEEIVQSQMAQAANVNNLKNNPIKPRPKVEDSKKKAAEAVPSGVRVLLTSLPKKKNVQRDLRSAFKEFRGIVDIVPAVSGNKKTKDPVCKGFAYVDFKSEVDATRFVQQFSGESIAFGKIQKQIKCRIQNSGSSTTSGDELTDMDVDGAAYEDEKFDEEEEDDHNNEISETLNASAIESMKSLSVSELNITENKKTESRSSSSPKKKGTKKSSASSKKKVQKVPKLEIPGSAKRLKVRDKAVLTGVFAKYGLQAAVATKEES
ncbi:unnamed protein product [Linum trigynum]|uniref:RRM domain-containing protein n=1 Tax=Linum trigynum TaxID=586398 RepID=A0AAV2CLY9_9ROSI